MALLGSLGQRNSVNFLLPPAGRGAVLRRYLAVDHLLASSAAFPLLAARSVSRSAQRPDPPFVYIACVASLLVLCLDFVRPSLVFVSFTNTGDSFRIIL